MLSADGSEHSKRAGEHAFHLASCTPDSRVVIVYVIDPGKAKSEVLTNWNSLDVLGSRKARIKEIELAAQHSGVTFQVEILHGDAGPTIVEYANTNRFDLVVIGSRGLNRLQEFVLGSVSHKVAKRVNCPVLIVK
nr:universal stress protein [Bacillus pinisoli]